MSLISQINSLASRVATEFNTIRGLLIPYDDTTPPATGQTLEFDGTNFVPSDPAAGGGGGGGYPTPTVTGDFGSSTGQQPNSVITSPSAVTFGGSSTDFYPVTIRASIDGGTPAADFIVTSNFDYENGGLSGFVRGGESIKIKAWSAISNNTTIIYTLYYPGGSKAYSITTFSGSVPPP